MDDFPEFMRNPRNAIDPKSQSPGNVGYVYDGIDGSQMAIWTSMEDVTSKEHVHPVRNSSRASNPAEIILGTNPAVGGTAKQRSIISNGVNDYDEYFIVVEGEYKLKINNGTIKILGEIEDFVTLE